ncbi:MAG: hypothetical protein WC261_03360 [Synergistaceae bacterium]|jgi:hypothetical protein
MSVIIDITGIDSTAEAGTQTTDKVVRNAFHAMMERDLGTVFFNAGEFAEPLIYRHMTGETENYYGIYQDPSESVSIGIDNQILDASPTLKMQEKTMKRRARKGDRVEIRGIAYKVNDPKPDGTGVIVCTLSREDRE